MCIQRIQIGSGPKAKRTITWSYVLSADTNVSNCSAKNLKKGVMTYWGLGTDFQVLGVVVSQSHLL